MTVKWKSNGMAVKSLTGTGQGSNEAKVNEYLQFVNKQSSSGPKLELIIGMWTGTDLRADWSTSDVAEWARVVNQAIDSVLSDSSHSRRKVTFISMAKREAHKHWTAIGRRDWPKLAPLFEAGLQVQPVVQAAATDTQLLPYRVCSYFNP